MATVLSSLRFRLFLVLGLALLATLLGLLVAFLLDLPSGASTVLVQTLLFALALFKPVFSGGK